MSDTVYACGKVRGIRTHCVTGVISEVELRWSVSRGIGGLWLQLHGGPTGYESLQLNRKLLADINEGPGGDEGWVACMGTEGRWDKLVVPFRELRSHLGALTGALRDYKEEGPRGVYP